MYIFLIKKGEEEKKKKQTLENLVPCQEAVKIRMQSAHSSPIFKANTLHEINLAAVNFSSHLVKSGQCVAR